MRLETWLGEKLAPYIVKKSDKLITLDANKIRWDSMFYKKRIDFMLFLHKLSNLKADDYSATMGEIKEHAEILPSNSAGLVWRPEEQVIVFTKTLYNHISVYKNLRDYELPRLLGVCKVLPSLSQHTPDWTSISVDFTKDDKEMAYSPWCRSAHCTLSEGDALWYLYKHLPAPPFKSVVTPYYDGEVMAYIPIKTPHDIPSAVNNLIIEKTLLERVCSELDKKMEKDTAKKVKNKLLKNFKHT